jgi:rhamnogalacturonyl hydrolase YesR
MKNIKKSLIRSRYWLVESGIQAFNNNDMYSGGVHAWYKSNEDLYDFIYTEITGYQISSLVEMYADTGEKIYIEHAVKAADWIINQAMYDNGGVLTRRYYNKSTDRFSEDGGLTCIFDTGMCLTGLMNLYSVVDQDYLLDAAIKMADFIIQSVDTNGNPYPLFDNNKNIFISTSESWSSQSATFLSKVCIGLYKLYLNTENIKYMSCVDRLMEGVISCQKSDGRFITNFDTRKTHIHPHCYTTEALIFLHSYNDDNRYKKAIVSSVNWLNETISQNPKIISSIIDGRDNSNLCERSDIVSQILRLFLYVKNKDIIQNSSLDDNIFILVNKLIDYQSQTEQNKENGGIVYGVHEDGQIISDINSWSTQFFAQAFYWLSLDLNGDEIDVRYLV